MVLDLRTIVLTWLKNNGYDGLCNTDLECGCTLDDLMPCDGPDPSDCIAGHIEYAPEGQGYDYFVCPGKRKG